MKNKLRDYAFNKLEIRILKEIAKGNHSLSQIRNTLLIKPSLLSYNLKKLLKKGIIKTTGKRPPKKVYFDNSKHASLFRELLLTYDHIKWETLVLN